MRILSISAAAIAVGGATWESLFSRASVIAGTEPFWLVIWGVALIELARRLRVRVGGHAAAARVTGDARGVNAFGASAARVAQPSA